MLIDLDLNLTAQYHEFSEAFCCCVGFDFYDKGKEILIAFKVKPEEATDLPYKKKWLQG